MANQTIIFANLQAATPVDLRAFDLYRLIPNAVLYRSKNQSLTTANVAIDNPKLWTDPASAIHNSTIIACWPDPELLKIGKGNKVILFAYGELTVQIINLLPVVDTIATFSNFEASIISRQLRRLGYKTPVARINPPFDISRYAKLSQPLTNRVGYHYDLNHEFASNLRTMADMVANTGMRIDYYGTINAYIHLGAGHWPTDVLEAMIAGRPVLVPKRPPYTEYVTDNFNGYLVRDRAEVIMALERLQDVHVRARIGCNAKEWCAQAFGSQYASEISNILNDKFFNLNIDASIDIERTQRKWLVRSSYFENGRLISVPETYDPSFNISNITSVKELIEFFLTQPNIEAYIFEFETPDLHTAEMNSIASLAERLGKRGRRIHFCTDNPIPEAWSYIFKYLSIVSVAEGLKQVA